jgi:hypothetical protein
MAYEMKDNSGSLFKNDRKETDSHPDYKGSALIGGVEHWLDAWINTAKDGSKYMALKMKPKDARTSQPEVHTGGSSFSADLDDDVPFVSCDPALERRVR